MPDCSFEELIPIFSARYSGDHLWLRPAMKRYGIWRLVHRSHPENSRPMTRSPRNHRITIIYQILHLMYCRTYVNLYDAVRSVIPCDKLHKHQFLCFAQVDSDCAIFSNFVNKGDIGPDPPYFFFYFTDSDFPNLTWWDAHLSDEQRHRAGSTLNLHLEAPQSENKNGGTGHGADFGKWQFYTTTVVLNKWTVVKSVANVLLKPATLCTAFKKCYFAVCCNSILSS